MKFRIILLILMINISIVEATNIEIINESFRIDKDIRIIASYDNYAIICSQDFEKTNKYKLINLEDGSTIWDKDNDFIKIVKSSYIEDDSLSFGSQVFVYMNNYLYAFDIFSGANIWTLKCNLPYPISFKVLMSEGYTISEDKDDYFLLAIDLTSGSIIEKHKIAMSSSSYNSMIRLYDISNDHLLLNINSRVTLINRSNFSILWQYPVYSDLNDNANIYKKNVILYSMNYDKPCKFPSTYIQCIDLYSGLEKWHIKAQDKYIIKDDYIYYFLGDIRCGEESKKSIGIFSISLGKTLNRVFIDDIQKSCYIFDRFDNILTFANFAIKNTNIVKLLYFDHNLSLINEQSLNIDDKFKLCSITYLNRYIAIKFYNESDNQFIFICYNFNSTSPSPPFNLIKWILDFILRKLTHQP